LSGSLRYSFMGSLLTCISSIIRLKTTILNKYSKLIFNSISYFY
jgi:hypothetical protein